MQSVLIFIRLSEKNSACEQTSRATFEHSGAVPMVKVLTCTFAANKELETWSSAILDHILKRFLLCPMWLNTDTSETLGLRQRLKDWMGDNERWWEMKKIKKNLVQNFFLERVLYRNCAFSGVKGGTACGFGGPIWPMSWFLSCQ